MTLEEIEKALNAGTLYTRVNDTEVREIRNGPTTVTSNGDFQIQALPVFITRDTADQFFIKEPGQ